MNIDVYEVLDNMKVNGYITSTSSNRSILVDCGYDIPEPGDTFALINTGGDTLPWADRNITTELFNAWKNQLLEYEDYCTQDPDELEKFNVEFVSPEPGYDPELPTYACYDEVNDCVMFRIGGDYGANIFGPDSQDYSETVYIGNIMI